MAKIIKTFFHFIPAIVLLIVYQTIPAIPFVKVSPIAYIFVVALFVAGVLLSIKQYAGVFVGIISTLIAVILSWFSLGRFDARTIIFCIISCIYYLYCAAEISNEKKH